MAGSQYTNRYAHLHNAPAGPGDIRPTTLHILQDEDVIGKLSDKIMLVTGGNGGLGVETIRALAATGAKVIFTTRDESKAKIAKEKVLYGYPEAGIVISEDQVQSLTMDLANLDSVRAAADEIKSMTDKLNVLVCNAGIAGTDESRTPNGFESQIAINHLGHFLLFNLLRPLLLASSTPTFNTRVIMLSSVANKFGPVRTHDYHFTTEPYDPMKAYASSKGANIWAANEIDRRYGSQGLHALSLHPGAIKTGLQANHGKALHEATQAFLSNPKVQAHFKSPEQGAATTLLAAVGRELEGKGSVYLENCGVAEMMKEGDPPHLAGYAPWAFDEVGARQLWSDSLVMVGLPSES